jgi:hypothetical protein
VLVAKPINNIYFSFYFQVSLHSQHNKVPKLQISGKHLLFCDSSNPETATLVKILPKTAKRIKDF